MATPIPTQRAIDPKLTENFLLNVVGVYDASVWLQGDDIHAHIVVLDRSTLTAKDFQTLCLEDLGLHLTPSRITVSLRHGFAKVA